MNSQIDITGRGRTFNDCLGLLTTRAFAGEDVAASGLSATSEFFVNGSPPAGASVAVSWFKDKIENRQADNKRYMLFLVGAPGNGKSYIAGNVRHGLSEIGASPANRHARKYEFHCSNGRKLVVVNDATIPEKNNLNLYIKFALTQNIESSIDTGDLLMVNVNRGILHQELHGDSTFRIGRLIIEWLDSSREALNLDNRDLGDWVLDDKGDKTKGSLRSAMIVNKASGLEICLLAVHIDRYSMFEVQPQFKEFTETTTGFPSEQSEYRVKQFDQRSSQYCEATPAGGLLKSFFDSSNFPEPSQEREDFVNPFASNLENFSKQSFVAGFQNILRAAELVSAIKVTYRELWGAISLAMIGNRSENVGNNLGSWLEANQPSQEPPRQRLSDFMGLANFRTHQTIFGAPQTGIDIEQKRGKTPITDMTSAIDPAIDAVLGEVSLTHQTTGNGWANPVLDAFQSQAEGESILQSLKDLLDATNDIAAGSITKFDICLDQEITKSLDGSSTWLTDGEKRFVLAWYGEYLTRLYALSHGIPAFKSEIKVMTDTLNRAQARSNLSLPTQEAIRTLLLPYYGLDPANRPVFLPLYSSRIVPIVERTEVPKLVLQAAAQLEFRVDTVGDLIEVELWSDVCVGKLVLDFPLLREALASVGNYAGYTELAASLTPRIERFRSAMLKSGKPNNGYFVVNGPSVVEISRD